MRKSSSTLTADSGFRDDGGGAETRTVGGHRHAEVDHDDVHRVHQDEIRHVDGTHQARIGGSVALQIDGGPALGDAAATPPGMSVSIVAGGYRLSAPERIELCCGASTIVMTPTGITISASQHVHT